HLVQGGADDDQLPDSTRKPLSGERWARPRRGHENDLVVTRGALAESRRVYAEGVLMASGGRSRLAAYVGRARKPAGAAVLKKDVAEAERRGRAEARPNLNMIVADKD